MAKTIVKPKLSLGNQLYLYRLLRDALECGKQTLMPGVEKALADGDMAAVDLGFENTRELLEALESCVQLTVFKGGRIYATVIAQPAWDEALAAGEPKQKASAKGAKSWKKKKSDKTLKAVKPKHVKRPEPKVEAAVEAEVVEAEAAADEKSAAAASAAKINVSESDGSAGQATVPAPKVAFGQVGKSASDSGKAAQAEQPAPESATEVDIEIRNETIFTLEDEQPADTDQVDSDDSEMEAIAAVAPTEEHAQPAISLTVIYDPEHSNAGIQTIESNPDAINEMCAKAEAKPKEETEPQTEAEAKTAPGDHVASAAPSADATQTENSDNAPATPVSTSASTQGATSPEPEADRKHAAGSSAKAKPKTEAESRSMPKPKHRHESSSAQKPKQSTDTKPQHGPAAPTPSAQAKSSVPAPAAPAKPITPAPAAPAKPSTPKIPEGYPVDFTTEVFCPGALLSDLSQLLPYGADVLGIVGEYYWIARENGSIDAQRNRATFPLRYTRNSERHEITVRIRRNTDGGMGAAWAIDLVESAD